VTEDSSALMLLGIGMTVSPSSLADELGAATLDETPPLDEDGAGAEAEEGSFEDGAADDDTASLEDAAADEERGPLEDGSAEALEETAAEEDSDAEKDTEDDGAAERLDDAPSGSSQAKLSPSSSSCRLRTLRAPGGQKLGRG
jgi:hypothetical protein